MDPPETGAHTREILMSFGVSETEIEELSNRNIIHPAKTTD
jgi:crotonobetainyl-CoA:carnitine CoA-transferase CaiB-like acyl-CoA transferase